MTTNLSCNHSNNDFISLNTLRPTQNGRHFPDDIFKWIFLNENVWISIKLKLKFVPNVPINNIPVLMMDSLLTHICATRSQWVKVKSFCLSDRLPIKSQCCVIRISDTTPSCVLQSGHDSVHKRMGIQRETSMPPYQLRWSVGYKYASGVRCCFWLNLSSYLTLHKSCLKFWLKSEIWLKSETAPHPWYIM